MKSYRDSVLDYYKIEQINAPDCFICLDLLLAHAQKTALFIKPHLIKHAHTSEITAHGDNAIIWINPLQTGIYKRERRNLEHIAQKKHDKMHENRAIFAAFSLK